MGWGEHSKCEIALPLSRYLAAKSILKAPLLYVQFEAGEAAREAKFDAKITWGDIDESAKAAAVSRIKGKCEELGLGQGDLMKELAEWKLWQIHRVARKPVLFGSKDRPVPQAAESTKVAASPRPRPYDPVRDCQQ